MATRVAALGLAPYYMQASISRPDSCSRTDLPPASEFHRTSAWVARSGNVVSIGPFMFMISCPLAILHKLLVHYQVVGHGNRHGGINDIVDGMRTVGRGHTAIQRKQERGRKEGSGTNGMMQYEERNTCYNCCPGGR